jgi:transposase
MRPGVAFRLSKADRKRLESLVADVATRQKHVSRAQIILLTAEGCGTTEVMRRTAKSKPTVWRWQARFMNEGVDGLLYDKTRRPGVPPLSREIVQRVVRLTYQPPPWGRKRWTSPVMATVVGISTSSVLRIWKAYRLKPYKDGGKFYRQ